MRHLAAVLLRRLASRLDGPVVLHLRADGRVLSDESVHLGQERQRRAVAQLK